uniref:Uncharacterized protein n=1 Tax=Cacopsylla melanoneura TaxID=428564 RepID=A0A8D8RRP9_9HEMI
MPPFFSSSNSFLLCSTKSSTSSLLFLSLSRYAFYCLSFSLEVFYLILVHVQYHSMFCPSVCSDRRSWREGQDIIFRPKISLLQCLMLGMCMLCSFFHHVCCELCFQYCSFSLFLHFR